MTRCHFRYKMPSYLSCLDENDRIFLASWFVSFAFFYSALYDVWLWRWPGPIHRVCRPFGGLSCGIYFRNGGKDYICLITRQKDIVLRLKCLSVWGFYIFEIFGYSCEKLQHILSAEKFISAVKVDGYDVKPGICLYENLCTDSWVDVTSVNFNSKKVLEDKIFGWQDILQFFSWASEDFKYVKSLNPG